MVDVVQVVVCVVEDDTDAYSVVNTQYLHTSTIAIIIITTCTTNRLAIIREYYVLKLISVFIIVISLGSIMSASTYIGAPNMQSKVN